MKITKKTFAHLFPQIFFKPWFFLEKLGLAGVA